MTISQIKKKGFIFLPTVIVVSLLIFSIAGLVSTSAYNELSSTAQYNSSSRAYFFAEAGVKDALRNIMIEKNYSTIGTGAGGTNCGTLGNNNCYLLDLSGDATLSACETLSDGCAQIRVEGGTITPNIVTVIGRYKKHIRKIQFDAVYNSNGNIVASHLTEIKNSPIVSTKAATSIGSTSFTMNGSANPNGTTVVGWFRRTNANQNAPSLCSNTDTASWPVRIPSGTSTIVIGSGTNPIAFDSGSVSVPQSNATYYYCAIIGTDGSTPVAFGRVFGVKTTN